MATRFKDARKLQGERVRMRFDDGRELIAQLLCATKDIDGSQHLIYDKIESGSDPGAGVPGCVYADARTLVGIEHADARKNSPTGRPVVRSGFEVADFKALRPSA
ncbi:MAG TPA: hypothetical protein VF865_04410 [Acidobacteriaceae bacterium]